MDTVADNAVKFYDINQSQFDKYVSLYFKHIDRVAGIITAYGIDFKTTGFYRRFSNKFWDIHNPGSNTDSYKTGLILSDVLSSRREYNLLLESPTNSLWKEDDFTSLLIYNKSQLTKNCLRLNAITEKYVDLRDLGY